MTMNGKRYAGTDAKPYAPVTGYVKADCGPTRKVLPTYNHRAENDRLETLNKTECLPIGMAQARHTKQKASTEMLNAANLDLIPRFTAPEWADTTPGRWTAEGVFTPEQRKQWYADRDLIPLRSDDPYITGQSPFSPRHQEWKDAKKGKESEYERVLREARESI